MSLLEETIARVGALDERAMAGARARHDRLTKPPGSLGRLEELGVWLAGVRRAERPSLDDLVIVVAAADHGVARAGVSAYPPEVTAQMVPNFLAGGAAVNVLARQAGARVLVVDAGMATELPAHPALLSRRGGAGTADISRRPAMPRETARRLVEGGIALARELAASGAGVVALGDMGIGNTTPSAAITAVFTGMAPAQVTGFGAGVAPERLAHKVEVVEQALAVNRPDPADPLGVLAGVGGFELGFLAGLALGAAAERLPVVLDGFITAAAALIARALCPAAVPFMLASHRSVEPGHTAALDLLGLAPLLDLRLRLGEGSGAALALPLLRAAAAVLNEMATFAEAGVSGSDDTAPYET